MVNQNDQAMSEESDNMENSSFFDQADGKFKSSIQKTKEQIAKEGVSPDRQVRATEDASLQDDSYSFDEANTDDEEYHDVDDEFDYDNDDDYVQ